VIGFTVVAVGRGYSGAKMNLKDHRPVKPQTQSETEPEAPPYSFSLREIGRLAVYRAAVLSGFYNEQIEILAEEPSETVANR
jgi:hypothetical protein